MWRTKGVKDVDSNWMLHWIKVTYDDEVVTHEALIKILAKEGFYVKGEPEFLQ
jgi:copper chaperone CopZ